MSSGIRHIGFELHFSLRHGHTGIDVWFWQEKSFPLWERIRQSPEQFDALVDAKWSFEKAESRPRACMSINIASDELRNESSWAAVHQWLGEKLSLVYEGVAPRLREEMDRENAAS